MTEFANLQPGFNETAYALSKTDFVHYLQYKFGDDATVCAVLDAFEKMGISVPESKNEFMEGTEGALVFLNRYGLVIRIELEGGFVLSPMLDRINNSPWILKPIASIKAGKNSVIEICPGCFLEKDRKKVYYLINQLCKQNINFCDYSLSNIGRIPVKTSRFPEGIPVVIDRLSVENLTKNIAFVRRALVAKMTKGVAFVHKSMVIKLAENIAPVRRSLEIFEEAREAAEVQEELYKPLRQAFDTAWPDNQEPDTQKMKQFWKLCQSYKEEEGKLVAGWNDPPLLVSSKVKEVKDIAAAYEARLESAVAVKAVVNPAAAAVYPLTPVPV